MWLRDLSDETALDGDATFDDDVADADGDDRSTIILDSRNISSRASLA